MKGGEYIKLGIGESTMEGSVDVGKGIGGATIVTTRGSKPRSGVERAR